MDLFVGEIRAFAFDWAPENCAKCNGQLLSIKENMLLFEVIGNTYGGDGWTTFGLPDMPPASESGPYYCITMQGDIPRRYR
jgi:microcystin-dependent protein